jgi:hypothetical protein
VSSLNHYLSFYLIEPHVNHTNREARVIFKAGKNRDGFFDADDLLRQVDHAIDIFEGLTKGYAQGLFLFDNAPSHQKRAPDAISARYMVKGALVFSVSCFGWHIGALRACLDARRYSLFRARTGAWCITVHVLPDLQALTSLTGPSETWVARPKVPNCPRMRCGTLSNGEPQSFYFPDDHPSMKGWFKGMENIIRERGLWPEGKESRELLAQCHGFPGGCPTDRVDCCCRRILFLQPDFVSEKSQLQELVESRGHLCDFYPKYHCELNFIEQYWGAAKLRFRMAGRATTIKDMERVVIQCLDDVPLLHIRR